MSEKPSDMAPQQTFSRNTAGHRQGNPSMTNYSIMASEEKDQYIEKLRRRNSRAREKITALESSNADLWKAVQSQQEVLQSMEKNLAAQKDEFRKELRSLRERKNAEISQIKSLVKNDNESDKTQNHEKDPTKVALLVTNGNTSAEDLVELESLRIDNSRLEEEVENMSKEMAELRISTNSEIFEKYRQLLADKDEELRTVRAALFYAKQEPKTGSKEMLSQTSTSNELEKIREELKETKFELNTLRNQQSRNLAEIRQTNGKLQNVELEKRLAESLLHNSRNKFEELAKKHQDLSDMMEKREQQNENSWLKKENLEIKRDLEERKKEITERTREAEEAGSQLQLLKSKVGKLEQEAKNSECNQQEVLEKMNQEKGILETSLEEKRAEIASLINNNELEKQRLSEEHAKLRQEHDWLIVSKITIVNAFADEIERLRKSRRAAVR